MNRHPFSWLDLAAALTLFGLVALLLLCTAALCSAVMP